MEKMKFKGYYLCITSIHFNSKENSYSYSLWHPVSGCINNEFSCEDLLSRFEKLKVGFYYKDRSLYKEQEALLREREFLLKKAKYT